MSDFRFSKPALPKRIVTLLGIGGVSLVALIGFWAFVASGAKRAEMTDMLGLIARTGGMTNSDGAVTGGLTDDAFYVGDTPQLAQAILQTNLQNLADQHAIAVEVIRTDQIEQIDGFLRLNLTLNGVAPEAELAPFLHGLAALEPIVLVEALNLRRARATARTDTRRRIAFQLQLYGLAQR